MSKKLRLLNKIFSSFVAFLLVFQSFSIYFLAQPQTVYAEDATPTPVETTTPAPEETSTPIPTETPIESTIPTETPSTEPTATPEVTPEPTVEPSPTAEVSPEPSTTPESSVEPTIEPTSGITTEPSVAPAPVQEEQQTEENNQETPTENPQVAATVVSGTTPVESPVQIIELPATIGPILTTNKGDYDPNEVVIFTGSGFKPNYAYEVVVTPKGSNTFIPYITSNEKGDIFFIYELDGTYRPEYKVEIKEIGGEVVKTITFTDGNVKAHAAPSGTTFTLTVVKYEDSTDCTGSASSPDVENGIDSGGQTFGVGHDESVTLQAAATSDQGGTFINWTSSDSFTVINPTTICARGTSTSTHHYYANYGVSSTGTLRVNKVTNPAGDLTPFTITAAGSGTITAPATRTTLATNHQENFTVTHGTYSISETVPAGWSKTGDTCQDVHVNPGSTVDCTITNTKSTTLTVNKICNPINDPGKFNLKIDGTTAGTGSNASCGGTTGAVVVSAAQHTVSETAGTSTSLSNYTSVIGGDCATNGKVTLSAGDNKICTITNTRNTGSVTVTKTLSPSGDSGRFDLKINSTTYASNVGNGGTTNAQTINTGSVTVAESAYSGTNLGNYNSNYSCTNGTHGSGTSATFSLSKDQSVTCVFTNTRKPGSISGYKWNDDDGDGIWDDEHPDHEAGLANWRIFIDDGDGKYEAGEASDETNGSGYYYIGNLTAGSYRVCEVEKTSEGWHNTSGGKCQDGVVVNGGQTTSGVNFGNQQRGAIKVCKVIVDAQGNITNGSAMPTSTFTINWSHGPSSMVPSVFTTGSSLNTNLFPDLDGPDGANDAYCTNYPDIKIGSYDYSQEIITGSGWETPKYNDQFSSTVLDLGDFYYYNVRNENSNGNINLALVGPTRTLVILNQYKTGAVTINKVTNPTDDNGQFNLKIGETAYATNVGNGGTTGAQSFSAGNYEISETAGTETNLDDYTSRFDCLDYAHSEESVASGSGTSINIDVHAGDNIICTFTNTKKGSVTITKFNDLDQDGEREEGEPDLDGWNITLGDKTQVTENGQTTFGSLVPDTYSLSELIKEGWVQTNIYCRGEKREKSIDHDNQYDVYVGAGENLNCYIGNYNLLPKLTIAKTNDKPSGVGQSEAITYTLTVENTGNVDVENVTVNDVPPGGFTYVAGSTLIDGAAAADPGISGGVLSWVIPTMAAGQKIVITYKLLTPSDLTAGIYTNYAACSGGIMTVMKDDFRIVVKGQEVACDPTSVTSLVFEGQSSNYGGSLTPLVLGASTEVLGAMLPATGSSTTLLVLAVLALSLGLLLNYKKLGVKSKKAVSKKKGKKNAKK